MQILELYVFVLAAFVGYMVISRVPPLLHTPLMAATNAISGISLVGSLIAAGAAHSRVTRAPRTEPPGNSGALEGTVRRAQSNGIERRGDERRQCRELVSASHGDVMAVDDALRATKDVECALHERPRRGQSVDAGSRSDPHSEVPHVVARQLVRLELHGSGQPPTFRRRRVHHDFFVRRRGASCEGAVVQGDAVRRRVV